MAHGNQEQDGQSVYAVVLAGGSGSRLWPLSRRQLPKQFLSLEHQGKSFLRATIDRLQPIIQTEDVWVVTGALHANGEAYAELQDYHTILEPEGRNTAPAIAVAAAWLLQDDPDAVMVVLPADHVIVNHDAFHCALHTAIDAAQAGSLVTFGIQPTRPDTGFGYIQVAASDADVRDVQRFTEKPDYDTACAFVSSGDYFWNSGMFVWRADVVLEQIRQHLPDVYTVIERMRSAWLAGEAYDAVIAREFSAMPDVSIDYGLLEKTSGIKLVPCEIGWSDVGSWDAVHEISDKDDANNVVQGNVLAVDCRNSLLRSSSRLLAAVDVDNLIVVETADAVLVVPRDQSQSVRKIVDRLKLNNASEHIEHVTVKRPWGSYTVLEEAAAGYKMKRIEVLPGARLSLQAHQHRSEHWVVVSGTATVTCGEQVTLVAKNESTYIPIGALHRLENRGKIPLVIVEIQVGDYLGEDDIERFDDAYGRAK